MSIKTIAVHLAGDADQTQRIRASLDLAGRLGARLVGTYALRGAAMPDSVAGRSASTAFLREIEEASRERANLTRAGFERICADRGVDCEWFAMAGDTMQVLAAQSTVCDLIVVSQSSGGILSELSAEDEPDEIAVIAACPALVLPGGKNFDTIGRRILIGWQPTRPAGRAAHDALPLLSRADEIVLAVIDEPADAPCGAARAAHWLGNHGIQCRIASISASDDEPAILLRELARDNGSDLVVIGAYGTSPFRELLMGGVTADFLADPPLPLFMAH